MRTRLFKPTSIICAYFLISACGLREATYINYVVESAPACETGLTSYADNVAAVVDSTCATSGCHAKETIKGAVLVSGNNETNRTVLLSYIEEDGTNLFNKIAILEEATHDGGDKSADLPLETIQTWMTVEAACPTADTEATAE